jgi:hypothetical protein
MTQTEDEVEDFLDRISWHPEIQAEGAGSFGPETSEMGMLKFHRRPLDEIFADLDDGKRCCIRQRCDEAVSVVHRPIPFNATTISFDGGEQRYRRELRGIDWYNRILERYVDAGYCPRSDSQGTSDTFIVNMFRSLPPDLAEVLKEGLDALHVLRVAQETPPLPRAGAAPAGEWTGHISPIEDDLWEDNNDCGYLRFEWDPATERRRCFPSAWFQVRERTS